LFLIDLTETPTVFAVVILDSGVFHTDIALAAAIADWSVALIVAVSCVHGAVCSTIPEVFFLVGV
jgi:hypothetical protein